MPVIEKNLSSPLEEAYAKIVNLHSQLIQKIISHLTPEQISIVTSIDIAFNDRMRTALGRAHYERNLIELNRRALALHPDELEATYAHEFAHLVAPLLYGRRGIGHQIGWRKTMMLLGYEPERTHALDMRNLQRPHKTVAFAVCECPSFKHSIKARRYRKMLRGRTRYVCLKCRAPLRLEK